MVISSRGIAIFATLEIRLIAIYVTSGACALVPLCVVVQCKCLPPDHIISRSIRQPVAHLQPPKKHQLWRVQSYCNDDGTYWARQVARVGTRIADCSLCTNLTLALFFAVIEIWLCMTAPMLCTRCTIYAFVPGLVFTPLCALQFVVTVSWTIKQCRLRHKEL